MRARALLLLLSVSGVAHAEGGWNLSRTRFGDSWRGDLWAGSRTVGTGLTVADAGGAFGAELSWAFLDRALEVRGGRQWTLLKWGVTTTAVSLGGSVFFVGLTDGGAGPNAGLHLSLGGDTFSVDLGLVTSAEVFFSTFSPRLPQRLHLGLTLSVGGFAFNLAVRAGADLLPGPTSLGFVGRAEGVFSISWARSR